MRLRNAALVCAGLLMPGVGSARDFVEVDLKPAVREYCHIVRFPGWKAPQSIDGSSFPKFDYAGDYEFRVPGLLNTTFLVRGFPASQRRYYTANLYKVDLSDPKAVARPASEEEWDAAAVVPLRYKGPANVLGKFIDSLGFHFQPSGREEGEVRVSPDRALLVLQSWSGKLGSGGNNDLPGGISFQLGRSHGKLFFDVYNTDTGKKLITVVARFHNNLPEAAFEKTGWVTERYFFLPLDDKRERCLVCEFGRTR